MKIKNFESYQNPMKPWFLFLYLNFQEVEKQRIRKQRKREKLVIL